MPGFGLDKGKRQPARKAQGSIRGRDPASSDYHSVPELSRWARAAKAVREMQKRKRSSKKSKKKNP